jgi:hypothetical protein
MTVMHHTTPKISPTTLFSDPAVPSPSAVLGATSDGSEPGWIIVETASGAFGGAVEPGVEVDDGSKQTLKWGYGIGALFLPPLFCFVLFCFVLFCFVLFSLPHIISRLRTSPLRDMLSLSSFSHTAARALSRYDRRPLTPVFPMFTRGTGVPTPDPALLLSAADDGSPSTLKWNYAPGGE